VGKYLMQPLFVTHFFNHAVTARRLLFVGWLLAETFNFIFYLFCFFCHLNNHHECSCYSCSLHLCQDVLLVGFFFFFTYVLCYAAVLSGVCVYMDLDFFSIFVWFFAGYGKTRGKKSVFLVCSMVGFFLFWIFFILFLHYVTLLLLVMNV